MPLEDNPEEIPYRRVPAAVITAMEEFANSEPKGVLIIHIDEAGSLVITGNLSKGLAIGMMEIAKSVLLP